jgi:Trk K+ transport system NAD-binding subunit
MTRVCKHEYQLQPRPDIFSAGCADHRPQQAGLDIENQCSIVAVERAGEMVMDFPPEFRLEDSDEVYVCGTIDALSRFYDNYQQAEQSRVTAPI